ncbi:DNA polymerase III subunit gamma/tau [Parablautia muri]|uniref:DNA-directed DNA polymerase n=1 Tax=Parablautia muri TaxID=2320879 RepID=A0A9X5BDW2_9FIRM|nr:DNA polymerase III subunit gamma/tau [Parablautia muri]NBJ91925.1 DNA polymerase III subunit gamma/tau [Parablautia muri]
MSYTALYRKFRPATFEDVKGQEHIVTTLKNQIKAERTSHAYLFCGTRGTGKTTIAKIFARAVNCENPKDGSPCGECAICKAIAAGASMNVIEIDAASNNGVDSIREIVDEVAYSPAEGKYKVYIIDEVHMLSIGAFNALLKTLEEPPSYVIFILATTEVHKIPVTIMSRCQRYDFRRITIETISDRLKELMEMEQVQIEDKAIRYIAKTADGSMRDALSLLDQCIAFHFGQKLTYDKVLHVLGAVDTEVFSRLLRIILNGDVTGAISLLEEIIMQGRELTQFILDFTWYLRNLLLVKTADGMEDAIDVSTENLVRLKEEAQMAENDVIMRYIRVLSEISGQIRYASQKRILVEMAIIKLCRPGMETDTGSLVDRIRQLEENIKRCLAWGDSLLNEKGVPVGLPVAGLAGNYGGTAVTPKPKVQVELPKAIPEDVKQAVGSWSAIVGETPMPMKAYLKNAYPSLAKDGSLLVIVQDGLPADYFREDSHKEEFENILANFMEKEIKVTIQGPQPGRNPEELFPDLTKVISQAIHMEVEELEEDAQDMYETNLPICRGVEGRV